MMLKALAKVMSPRTYQLDEVLYYEGEKAMNMIIIAIGECVGEVDVHSETDVIVKTTPHYLAPKESARLGTKNAARPGMRAQHQVSCTVEGKSPVNCDYTSPRTQHSVDVDSLDSASQLSASIISKKRRESRMQVGRLGPASILAPFVAACESIMEEVYHSETVKATTLLQTYVVFKNDFIHHIQEPIRTEIRKLLKSSPTYIMPDLWDLHTKSMGEQEWKAKKAWDMFKRDLRAGKSISITSRLKALENVHRTDSNGNRTEKGSTDVKTSNTAGGSKLASTLADFAEAFLTRSNYERAQIKKLTSTFRNDELVDMEINASKRRGEEKSLHRAVHSQPDFRKHEIYIPSEDISQDKTFGLTRKTVVFPASMAQVLNQKHDPRVAASEAEAPTDPNDYILAKGLVTESTYPVVHHPYSLIHIHRENFSADNKAVQPRVSYCYYRLSGTMPTLLEAKDCASRQMQHAYINCLTHDTDIDQPEIILDWKTFTSFDTIGVSNTDFFITYFRSVPMEYASFTPKVNLLNKVFPAEGKPLGQRFSCVRFSKVDSCAVDDPFQALLKPKYIQELGILKEVLASTFTLADCCRYLLLNTSEGRDLRLSQQQAQLGADAVGIGTTTSSMGSPSNHTTSRTESILTGLSSSPAHQKPSHIHRLDTNGTGAGKDLHEDNEDFDEGGDNDAPQYVTCVVPLFQWISMAPESFESLRLQSLLFVKDTEEVILSQQDDSAEEVFDPNAANLGINIAGQAGKGAPRTLTELKHSLREAGLLPPTDDDGVVADNDIVERTAIQRTKQALRSGPGIKLAETQTTMHDMLQIVDTSGMMKRILPTQGQNNSFGEHSARGKPIGDSGLLKPVVRPTARHTHHHHHFHHPRGASDLSGHEEGMYDEMRANILKDCTAARSTVVKLNDDFCFGELYTPFGQRRNRVRLPSSTSLPQLGPGDEDIRWSATNLAEQGRKLRSDLEELGRVERFRHNPVVSVGVDRGTAEGHLLLLETMSSLPTSTKLMAEKKQTIHQQLKAGNPANPHGVSQSISSSVLGVVHGPKDRAASLPGHVLSRAEPLGPPKTSTLHVSSSVPAFSHVTPSVSILRSSGQSLSNRLDTLHDILNGGFR